MFHHCHYNYIYLHMTAVKLQDNNTSATPTNQIHKIEIYIFFCNDLPSYYGHCHKVATLFNLLTVENQLGKKKSKHLQCK